MSKNKLSPVSQPQPQGEAVENTAQPKQNPPKVFRYQSPFIDETLVKSVLRETVKIKTHLIDQGKGELQTGSLLLVLRGRFEATALERTNVAKEEWLNAFFEYVQVQFGIKASRANEYIQVSLKLGTFLPELALEVSKLVEISRLEKADIQSMIKAYSIEKLKELSYREVKNIVRKFNPKSRDTTKVEKTVTADNTPQLPQCSSPVEPAPSTKMEAQVNGVAPIFNLADFQPQDRLGIVKAFTDSIRIIKGAVGDGEIPAELAQLIDELYQWKREKEAKKASGN